MTPWSLESREPLKFTRVTNRANFLCLPQLTAYTRPQKVSIPINIDGLCYGIIGMNIEIPFYGHEKLRWGGEGNEHIKRVLCGRVWKLVSSK